MAVLGRLDPHHAAPAHRAGKAERMRIAAQRHDRAMREGHRLRQSGDAFLQPIEMARQEFIGVGEARIDRHGEHGAAARFAHLQAEPPRARAPAEQNGKTEPADLNLDGLAAPEIEPLKHGYAPYRRSIRPRIRRPATVAQAFEGRRRLCFRQCGRRLAPRAPYGADVSAMKSLIFGAISAAEARSVEHAIMADAGLQMMLAALRRGRDCAQNMCSVGLAESRRCRPSRLQPSSAPPGGSCPGRPARLRWTISPLGSICSRKTVSMVCR